MFRKILSKINKLFPKFEQVIVISFPNIEGSAIEVANYISKHYEMEVYYVVAKEQKSDPSGLLQPAVKVIIARTVKYFYKCFTCKYIFFTHGTFFTSFSSKQIVVNIWHGVFYKKIGRLLGHPPVLAHLTVATSDLTEQMFCEAFGVRPEDVVVSGYPRNDILIRAKAEKETLKRKIDQKLSSFNKLAIWLPTYRKSVVGEILNDGTEVANPFYVKDFDVHWFNHLLAKHNTLCIIKPHPMAPVFDKVGDFNNLLFINEEWLAHRNITLYHLVGCSDLLISDVSSVIIDYLLLDQPVVCISEDFKEYSKTRGFYFRDLENWVPSKIISDQFEFFDYLSALLMSKKDPYEQQRLQLKTKFFSFHDARSTERLLKRVFDSDKVKQ